MFLRVYLGDYLVVTLYITTVPVYVQEGEEDNLEELTRTHVRYGIRTGIYFLFLYRYRCIIRP